MKCEKYWPENGTKQQHGDVLVTSIACEVYAEYTIRTVDVSDVILLLYK